VTPTFPSPESVSANHSPIGAAQAGWLDRKPEWCCSQRVVDRVSESHRLLYQVGVDGIMERETGLEPEVIRFRPFLSCVIWFVFNATGTRVLPGVSVNRWLVIAAC
jgi:hypothetical protein